MPREDAKMIQIVKTHKSSQIPESSVVFRSHKQLNQILIAHSHLDDAEWSKWEYVLQGPEKELRAMGAFDSVDGPLIYMNNRRNKIACKISEPIDRYALSYGDVYHERETWNMGLKTVNPTLVEVG
jgi:hypothetical protein